MTIKRPGSTQGDGRLAKWARIDGANANSSMISKSSFATVQAALHSLSDCHRIVVFTGAGISTSSGIPDFRSKRGLFRTSSGRRLFDAVSAYINPAEYMQSIERLIPIADQAQPSKFHQMLGKLGNCLLRVYSQNVDGLEAKVSPPLLEGKVVLLHGCLTKLVCSYRPTHSFDKDQNLLWQQCPSCTSMQQTRQNKRSRPIGEIRPRISLYNELTYDEEDILNSMNSDLAAADGLIIAGTTLSVGDARRSVKQFAKQLQSRGRPVIWVSEGKCCVKDAFNLNMSCDEFAALVVEHLCLQ